MIAILMLGGFFRSLQFTSINALAYAEVPAARMSRATALAAVGQQVSLATGVAVGALAVEMVVRLNDQATIMASDFPPGFLLVGLIAASSALIFMLLPPNAGAEMANRVPPTTARVGPADGLTMFRGIAGCWLQRPRSGKIRRCFSHLKSLSRLALSPDGGAAHRRRRRAASRSLRRAALHRSRPASRPTRRPPPARR